MTEAGFRAQRLAKLRRLQELRRQRNALIAEDPGGARRTLIEQHPTALDFAERFDLRTKRTPALELIAQRMRETVTSSDGRLVLSIPPQEGKSTLTRWLIAWLLCDNPDRRIVYASFAQSLARTAGRDVRNKLKEHPELCLPLDMSHRDATDWGIEGRAGGLYSVGVGGALTGRPADCMVIDDPLRGQVDADSPLVRDRLMEWWSSTSRTRLAPGAPVLVIQCMTGDTPVLMANGLERPLRDVRPGDSVATYDNGRVTSSTVRNWANQGPDAIYSIRMKSGRVVRANARHPFLTIEGGELAWRRTDGLVKGSSILTVIGGSGAVSRAPSTDVTRLPDARGCASLTTARSDGLTASAPRPSTPPPAALHTSSIGTDSAETSSMRSWSSSGGFVLSAANRPRARTLALIGTASSVSTTTMRPAESGGCSATTAISRSAMASPRPCSVPPLTTYRPVPDEVVEVAPCGLEDVFDLQIDRTENFIANGLISHNTRWHEEDLAGQLIEQGWPYLNIPALADGQTEDALDREPGEWLISARGRTKQDWEAVRTDVGERTFAALYQGRPAPLEGGIFKYEWFDAHRIPEDKRPAFTQVVVGVDPADTGKGDAAGILVAGTTAAGKIVFTADLSAQLSQAQWARQACLAWVRHGASRIVQEHNLGMRTSIPDAWALLYRQAQALADAPEDQLINGDGSRPAYASQLLVERGDHQAAEIRELGMLLKDFRDILDAGVSGPRVVSITPKQSKRVRAESVAGAFETGRACILGRLPKLEHEGATWQEGQKSPNRIDTLAMLTTHLETQRGKGRISRAKTAPALPAATGTDGAPARVRNAGGVVRDISTARRFKMAPLPPNDPRGEIGTS